MINVTFYNFSKRKNSTALPGSGTASAVVPVLLKDGCSQESPVLELNSHDPDNYNNYNYCYIPFFSRYYFVNAKTVDTGERLILSMEEDYLGSFKTEILTKSGFILYSSNGSLDIPDNRLATTKNFTESVTKIAFPITVQDTFFISLTGKNGVETYVCNRTDINDLFKNILYDPQTISAGSDVMSTLADFCNAIIDALKQNYTEGFVEQNLRSAYMLPIAPRTTQYGSSKRVYAGQFDTGVSLEPLINPIASWSVNVSIPWTVNDWRRMSPYTSIQLYLLGVGCVDLNPNELINTTNLYITVAANFGNGDIEYIVYKGDVSGKIIYKAAINVYCEYGVGSTHNAANNLVGGVAKGLSVDTNLSWGDYLSQSFGALGMGIIGSGLQGLADMTGGRASGGNGSAGLGGSTAFKAVTDIRLHVITKTFTQAQSNFALTHGYPLFTNDSFAAYTGFLQCEGFNSDCNATKSENDTISAYINSGIYIE